MSSSLSETMHQILDRFDEAWNGPSPPRIEDFMPPPDSPAYLPMLTELVKIDLERRFKRGEQPTAEEYRQRFPACSAAVLDEAREAARSAASGNKQTDDPGVPLTLEGPLTPSPFEPSKRLVGEYELLQRLGGNMGDVYKARHRRLDKLVALKLLPADPRHPFEAAARFQREMKAVGALDHPNVVEAHDAGEQSGVIYLAMKLIDGVDLERLVRQRGPLPIAEACDMIRQAALGLHYLHQRGLVHRDVKPSNLMWTPEGAVKVLDLGLARWRLETEEGQQLTGADRVMGTPEFLAPEQIENAAQAGIQADLYGLGGTLFYLLTARAPFADRKSLFSKLDAHRFQPPPDVRTLRSEVPAELATLVDRLLAKNPHERYASAAEVAAALAPFAGKPTLPPAPALRPQAIRWPPVLALAGAMALLVLMFVISGMGSHHPKPETKTSPPAATQPIRLTLEVLHRPAPERFLMPGNLGEEAFDTRFGDAVTVKARLTPPAYAFLIAFRPDGVVEGIFPEPDDRAPIQKDSLSAEYELNDGDGLQIFVAVGSSQPLPSFKDWWARCRDCPWGKFQATSGIVWRSDGVGDVEDLYAVDRGKPKKRTGRQAVKELADWLHQRPEVETVQVLGFRVEPKEKR